MKIDTQTAAWSPIAFRVTSTTLFRDPSRGADSTGFGLGMIHSF